MKASVLCPVCRRPAPYVPGAGHSSVGDHPCLPTVDVTRLFLKRVRAQIDLLVGHAYVPFIYHANDIFASVRRTSEGLHAVKGLPCWCGKEHKKTLDRIDHTTRTVETDTRSPGEQAEAAGLILFNGRGGRRSHAVEHYYVAARSNADAVRLVRQFEDSDQMTVHELRTYWSKGWGNPMRGVKVERGVWVQRAGDRKIVKVV